MNNQRQRRSPPRLIRNRPIRQIIENENEALDGALEFNLNAQNIRTINEEVTERILGIRECPICLDDKDNMIKIHSNIGGPSHEVCKDCIEGILRTGHDRCPLCRKTGSFFGSRKSYKKSRKSYKKSRVSKKRHSKEKCKKLLSNKIRINTKKMNNGKLKSGSGAIVSSREQAIAISYSQLKKKYPKCKF